jgi:RNA polymerase sigma-70 factor (ECF subfamily)
VKAAGDIDADLLARAARGDARAASELVRRRLPRLVGLARRLLNDAAEAEDVAQEAFMRLWDRASRWRSEGARVETWLWTVATRLCLDRLRRRRPVADPEALDALADPGADPLEGLLAAERAERVARALMGLPDRQRVAIVLRHQEGLSQAEAARLMEIREEALESLLARARRTLRARLLDTETGDDPSA